MISIELKLFYELLIHEVKQCKCRSVSHRSIESNLDKREDELIT